MPKCASCEKEVYITEEFRCLDQIWHKSCFRCETCRKTLNVHNCKGYGGKPYCTVHYPQCKSFTFVRDTPEFKQISENTKNMSKVAYHKDYEENRGRKISVADDVNVRGQQEISKIISQTGYSQRSTNPIISGTVNTEISENRAGGSWYSESVAYPTSSKVVNLRVENNAASPYNNKSPLAVNGAGGDSRAENERGGKNPNFPIVSNVQSNEQTIPINPTQVGSPDLVLLGGLRVTGSGKHFRAVYDYDAGDTDEVTFREGDLIVHGEPIDDGWMYGTVKRTGEFGMLPSNYVVPIQNQ